MKRGEFVYGQQELWKKHKLRNPAKVMFLTFLTLGLYMPTWFFLITKNLEKNNIEVPSSYYTFFVLFFIPLSLFFLLKYTSFVFPLYDQFLLSVSRWMGVFSITLIVKYVFDFCVAYGEFTKTIGIAWFMGFFIGYIGILGIILNNYYLIPLMIIFPILLAGMQAQLNFWIETANLKD